MPVHLAHGERRRQLGVLEHDADPLAMRRARAPRVDAEHLDRRRRRAAGSPRGSRPSSSCRRRSGRAGRRPRRVGPRSRCRGPPRRRRRTSEARDADRGRRLSQRRARDVRRPPGGKPGSRPVTASAISEQSGWWPTVATGPPASVRRARRSASTVAPGARSGSTRTLGARRLGHELGRLPRAHERAREHERRAASGERGEPLAERPACVDALRRQLAQLVGLALGGRGVAAEVDDASPPSIVGRPYAPARYEPAADF